MAIPDLKIGLTGDIFINGKFIGRGKGNLSTLKKGIKVKQLPLYRRNCQIDYFASTLKKGIKVKQLPKILTTKVIFNFEDKKQLKRFLTLFQISTIQNAQKSKN